MKNKAAIILNALLLINVLPVSAEVAKTTASTSGAATPAVPTASTVTTAASASAASAPATVDLTTASPSACAVIAKVLEEKKNSKGSKSSSKAKKDIAKDNAAAAELLAINTDLDKASEHDNGPETYKPLEGSATYTDINAFFGNTANKTTKAALSKVSKYNEAAKAVAHYSTGAQKSIRAAKDALNYMIPYRGFSMSMEGARVILDQDQKVNNLFVAELTKQRMEDEMHSKVMVSMMQIAHGMGLKNPDDSKAAVQQGVDTLKKLTSEEQAQETLAAMNEMKDQLNVPEGIYEQHSWDVDTTNRIYQKALDVAAADDPLIDHIKTKAKKYIHSTAFNIAASTIQSTLAAATMMSGSPMISVGAELASTAFVMSTGGPEENKILAELYFGKRMEIRRKRISDEVQLAMSNYDKALMTHNGPQLAMSEIVLADLIGYDQVPAVIERKAINDFGFPEPSVVPVKDGTAAVASATLTPNLETAPQAEATAPATPATSTSPGSPAAPTAAITQATPAPVTPAVQAPATRGDKAVAKPLKP